MRTNVQVVLALVASAGFVSAVHAQAKVELEYKPRKSDGLDAGVQFKYDISSQKSAARTGPPAGKGPDGLPGQAGFGFGTATEASDGKAGGTARTIMPPDVAKVPAPPAGPVPIPYPNTPIDVKPPVVRAPLPIIAQPVAVAPKPVIVEPVPQPAIKLPYSAPVNRR